MRYHAAMGYEGIYYAVACENPDCTKLAPHYTKSEAEAKAREMNA